MNQHDSSYESDNSSWWIMMSWFIIMIHHDDLKVRSPWTVSQMEWIPPEISWPPMSKSNSATLIHPTEQQTGFPPSSGLVTTLRVVKHDVYLDKLPAGSIHVVKYICSREFPTNLPDCYKPAIMKASGMVEELKRDTFEEREDLWVYHVQEACSGGLTPPRQ